MRKVCIRDVEYGHDSVLAYSTIVIIFCVVLVCENPFMCARLPCGEFTLWFVHTTGFSWQIEPNIWRCILVNQKYLSQSTRSSRMLNFFQYNQSEFETGNFDINFKNFNIINSGISLKWGKFPGTPRNSNVHNNIYTFFNIQHQRAEDDVDNSLSFNLNRFEMRIKRTLY